MRKHVLDYARVDLSRTDNTCNIYIKFVNNIVPLIIMFLL